jgi:hypothetical protein
MGPTRRVDEWRRSADPVFGGCRSRQGLVAAKGIGLDYAAKEGEMIARPLTPAIGAEAVISSRCPSALPWPLVNHIGPQPTGPSLAVAGGQHRDRRVVGVDDRRCHDMSADQLGQWHRPPGGMPDPVGQGGALDLDAFTREDHRLTVKRQPVEVFADHDIGNQARTRPALLDRKIGCRCLHDALAAAAAELGPNMADHPRLREGRLLRRAGIFSKTSVTSSPSLLKRVPPQPGHTEPG